MGKGNGLMGMAVAAAMGLSLMMGVPAWAHEEEHEDYGGHLIPHQIAGLDFNGGVTWFLQGSSGNGANDSTDLTYTLDLNLEGHISDTGTVNLAVESGNGAGIDDRLGSLSTTNYDAFITELTTGSNDFNTPSISQLYYEGDYYEGGVTVDFGKLDVHSMYDDNAYANDETDQFLSAIFTRSAGTTYAELDQYYAPGLAITAGLGEQLSLMGMVANGIGSGFSGVTDRPYVVGQVTYSPSVGDLAGNYRVYGIVDNRVYTEIGTGAESENVAWGVSVDQALPGGLGVFGRYSSQDDSIDENAVESSWSLGAVMDGSAWDREGDVVGVGYGSVVVNQAASSIVAITNADDENHLEAYYKIAYSDHFTLTPDLQVVFNNGGNADSDIITVFGVRGQMNF